MSYPERGPNIIITGGSWDKPDREWVLVLNKYQRDNLLWLLNMLGYGGYDKDARNFQAGGVEPFTLANNGDWVGEIALMMGDPKVTGGATLDAEATGKTNCSRAYLQEQVELWLKRSA